ncbi:MAG: Ni/Fe hydrogenase subunit alpha [Planctomycetota bacterium]|nr:MAG: Ni/Fe hydrogenase subunit alpha [Planctomycetota bacterium]
MSQSIDINVHHLTRVEGHGNIVIKADDGTIEKVEWQVPEAPRFFEAMVRGRSWMDIQTITCRICGICSISHSLASIKATEDAMGIGVSEQTRKLRLLTHCAEQLQSHSLHVGYLAAPDLFGVKSVVPLVASHPDVVKTVIRIHRVSNEWSDLLGGRTTHPITIVPGGHLTPFNENDLRGLKKTIEETTVPDLKTLAEVILSVADKLPAFDRPTEYIALSGPDYYTFYDGDIASSDVDEKVSVREFEKVANEYVSPQSTAKWARWHRESYAVGALARFNINADRLLPLAAETAKKFGLEKGCCNPYMNNVAQVVECVQVCEHGIQLIDELLSAGLKPEERNVTVKAGTGVGCVEAPRGILFHKYTYDEDGICTGANICIPTNENHANIQKDFEVLVPQFIGRGKEELQQMLEMLVRSYDPCISCSAHYLDVKFA